MEFCSHYNTLTEYTFHSLLGLQDAVNTVKHCSSRAYACTDNIVRVLHQAGFQCPSNIRREKALELLRQAIELFIETFGKDKYEQYITQRNEIIEYVAQKAMQWSLQQQCMHGIPEKLIIQWTREKVRNTYNDDYYANQHLEGQFLTITNVSRSVIGIFRTNYVDKLVEKEYRYNDSFIAYTTAFAQYMKDTVAYRRCYSHI